MRPSWPSGRCPTTSRPASSTGSRRSGLVDDVAFAREWVEQRQSGRGLARRALAQELRRKGVDDEVVRETLDEVDPDDEVEAARAVVRAKLRSVRSLDREKAVRRLVGVLARKGHSSSVAYRVVTEELGAAAEAEVGDEWGITGL